MPSGEHHATAPHDRAMRFVIVGPGALGSILGVTLADAGHEVVLLGRPSSQLDALRDRGLRLTATNTEGAG